MEVNDRAFEVLFIRLDRLRLEIAARAPWPEIEFEFARVLSQVEKITGTRGRPADRFGQEGARDFRG